MISAAGEFFDPVTLRIYTKSKEFFWKWSDSHYAFSRFWRIFQGFQGFSQNKYRFQGFQGCSVHFQGF